VAAHHDRVEADVRRVDAELRADVRREGPGQGGAEVARQVGAEGGEVGLVGGPGDVAVDRRADQVGEGPHEVLLEPHP
jgi:hypothetical protein